MISKNILFIFYSIFFLLWIFINNLTKQVSTSLLVLLTLVVLFLCYYLYSKKYLNLLILSILWLLIWITISDYNIQKINTNSTNLNNYYDNYNHKLIIEIKSINKINDFQIEYLSQLIQIWDEKIETNINLIAKLSKNNILEKWNIISFNSKLYEFKDFNGFSYKKYMLSKNIYFSSNIYSYELLEKWNINFIEKNIIELRKLFLSTIYKIYPKEEAIFLWWILIWARESLPKDLKQDFNNSWLTHFIAVSWFNITILIIFLTYIASCLPISLRVVFITIWIAFFTILVGYTAPVIRASIMGLIWYYIISSGRKWEVLSIILLTLSIMLIFSPYSLNYDVSLHLSFLAVLWIIYTWKFFEKLFFFLPEFLEIKTAFTLTLSSLSFTLPIMIFNFGQVSILAPFANIAVAWTIALAMTFGFISIIVYFVHPFAWIILWYLTWIFLKWDITVVHFFWKQEWSLIKFDLWIYKYHIEILYFMILIFVIIWFRKKEAA